MKKNAAIIFALCAVVSAAAGLLSVFSEEPVVELCAFDVGQGDSLFLQTKNGRQWLVDGGPSSVVLSRLGAKIPPWDRTIDGIILTHPHADHLVGLISVLDRYEVGEIIATDVRYDSPLAGVFEDAAENERANYRAALSGTVFEEDGVSLRIVAPGNFYHHQSVSDVNESSVVMELRVDDMKFLLMGDSGEETERALLRENVFSKVDILKVGHHGSARGSSSSFLNAIRPAMAIISSGADNRYGHPHRATLDRLQKIGARIFRTDTDGTVCVSVENGELHTRTRASWISWWI